MAKVTTCIVREAGGAWWTWLAVGGFTTPSAMARDGKNNKVRCTDCGAAPCPWSSESGRSSGTQCCVLPCVRMQKKMLEARGG